MATGNRSYRISTILNVSTGLLFSVVFVVYLYLLNDNILTMARIEAESKSRIILDRNLSTHHYFSYVLKPKLFEWTEPFRDQDYFDSTWMSSTYAVREIDDFFQELNPERYYYKECSINARNPKNEADEVERSFLNELQNDPNLIERSDIREFDGKPYFVLLRRGEVLESACLRCHRTPDEAPSELVHQYGVEKSFFRNVGDVVSAISIRVPLSDAYLNANRLISFLSITFFLLLVAVYGIHSWLNRIFLFNPLARIRDKAQQISADRHRLGEEIPLSPTRELTDLTVSFNHMSHNLRDTMDHLDERVQERTVTLTDLNRQLESEINERVKVEKEKERLIQELQRALADVKQLSGFLPICSSCKKIRDDKGYWNQIESYIHEHSGAEFSHSLCPQCAKELYPDYYKEE